MKRRIKRAAVLGAGIMGSRIAALLAGVDIPTHLLDIVPTDPDAQDLKKGLTRESPEFRSKLARMGIQATIGASPPAMFSAEDAKLITPGNFEDNLEWLADADWIIEVVAEDLAIKRQLLSKAERFIRPGTIISTNTSGLSIDKIAGNLSPENKSHFLGTHFFNPPRHMKLLEIIPGQSTDRDIVSFMIAFCEKDLGKSVVIAKDTPNFIANRVGIYSMLAVIRLMIAEGYTIEEVDAITGPPMGRPRSASFRTSDMVGLDTFVKVAQNVADNVSDPLEKEQFMVPQFVARMVENGMLGDKTQKGFYKKVMGAGGSQILALDYTTMEYVPQRPAAFAALDNIKRMADPAARLKTLVFWDDRAGHLAWSGLKKMLVYCAEKIPEIADDVVSVDRAMRWGYNWELGPFEMWDAIGLRKSVELMEKEGEQVPENVRQMLSSGRERFYDKRDGTSYFYDFRGNGYLEIKGKPEILLLPSLKERERIVRSNPGASLIDLGDGVLCLEFHSPNNVLDLNVIQMMNDSVAEVEQNFEGMVISNQGTNFCVGADLKQVYPAAENKEWNALALAVEGIQQACMRVKYCDRPVVVAPFRMTLGGGCEIALAGARVRPFTECYMGLVEVGVGLIPAGGGCKEMVVRATEWVPPSVPSAVPGGGKPDLIPYIARAFETVAMAKVSSSAREAQGLGYLNPSDGITMNYDRLIYDAKDAVLALARRGYRAPRRKNEIRVPGRTGRAILELMVYLLREGLYISDHDALIARRLAHVLTGGDVDHNALVTEDYILELEKEAFVSLCGEEKSRARMKHMLETNRPLRN